MAAERGELQTGDVTAPHCHHYEHISEVPWDISKYWHQRRSIWSKYDEGILMTDDAWFGVTPEAIAQKIAAHLTETCPPEKTTIIDIFAGAGGNAIAFALSGRWQNVYAIEKNFDVLTCARNNAAIYGVLDKITFIHGDSFSVLSHFSTTPVSNTTTSSDTLPTLSTTLPETITPSSTYIFASPPWGGPGYTTDIIFDLSLMQPYSLTDIEGVCARFDHALFLPRTSDLRQIARLAGGEEKIDVVQYCMEGASKGLVVYLPGKN